MTDSAGTSEDRRSSASAEPSDRVSGSGDRDDSDLEALRREVEEKYDFDEFGPADMARMNADEWDVAFDPDTWITGDRLLDRLEAELKTRIARREIFGTFDRVTDDDGDRLVVYSDEGYAVVHANGDVRGRGTILRDVEPLVALCSMDSYEVSDPPTNWSLPDPEDVSGGSSELGNLMMQIVAGVQLIAAVLLVGAWLVSDLDTLVAPAMGIVFFFGALFLFSTVANARLSDRFRSEEYRNRLRALREAKRRPDLPEIEPEDDPSKSSSDDRSERVDDRDDRPQ
ncbi:hypothetical protein ACERIT_10670 [Halopenitus sp. H-Gu1]|uniref:DUF7319 domain-containing protein n=1 Tax=Halopenitus sp. H-Gu1 TaxID=3242697 RepID=UPI00359DB2CC